MASSPQAEAPMPDGGWNRHPDTDNCPDVIPASVRGIVTGPRGPVQTNAFEIEDDVIKAIYVMRNPDKLRHLAPA